MGHVWLWYNAAMQNNSPARPDSEAEVILKEHRRWTRWIRGSQNLGEGNLTLTNRRLLFLYRITSSPEVAANIQRLKDTPVEDVLNYALTLHKNNFQIPLSSVVKVGVGFYLRFLLPHFHLRVSYLEAKKKVPRTFAFQFRRPMLEVLLRPQIIEVWTWAGAIKRAIRGQK